MSGSSSSGRARGDRRRLVAVGVGAIAAIVLLALALVFANSFGAARVAENARSLHWTNATLGSAAIARAAVAQAVVFGVDHQLGVASDEAAATAQREAAENIDELERWVFGEGVPLEVAPLAAQSVRDLVLEMRHALIALNRQDPEAAAGMLEGDIETAYIKVNALLETEQNTITQRIDDTEAVAGMIGGATRLLLTLLIPAGALVFYRTMVRRQALRRELSLSAKLKAERELRLAKDQFIAGISHELRTPLTSIYGFSEVLIEQGIVDPDAAMELMALINNEWRELSRMVEDLLTAARLDAGAMVYKIEEFPLREEVESVTAPFTRSGEQVFVTCPDVIVAADQLRFRQILRNLLSNAIKHGGPEVSVLAETDGNTILLAVVDDGPGVPTEIEGRLFKRFVHEADEPLLAGSVGLGLSIARPLANGMGGDLSYDRFQDETWFTLRLPLAAAAAVPVGTGNLYGVDASYDLGEVVHSAASDGDDPLNPTRSPELLVETPVHDPVTERADAYDVGAPIGSTVPGGPAPDGATDHAP